MNDFFRAMQQITDAYREKHGLPVDPPVNPQERKLARALVDEAHHDLYDAIEARQMQAEAMEDAGVNSMLDRALGREP